MVTTASKLYFGAAVAALVASWAYGLGTDGQLIGVVFMGFKGSVGDQLGYILLQALAWSFAGLGVAASILRDADPEVQAAAARLEAPPPVVVPTRVSYWPVLGALAAVVAAVGLVASPVLFVIGLLGAGLVLLEWMVSAWADRATGDPEINRRIRNRLMYPIEIPLFGALGILVVIVSISRVLLAVDRISSSVTAIVVAALVLAVAFLVAYRPRVGKNAVAGLLVLFAVLVITGGIIGAASGTREFEPHQVEHTDQTDESGQTGQTGASAGDTGGAELPGGTGEGEG
jgi:hypothetical protein